MGDISLRTTIQEYLHQYGMGGKHTAKAKRTDLNYFLEFLLKKEEMSNPDDLTLKAINHSAVEQFIEARLRLGEAPATVIRRLATIKHFCRMCAEEGRSIQINPARLVRAPALQTERPKALSEEVVAGIVESLRLRCENDASYRNLRDELLVLMLLHTGLRADEIRILRFGQLSKDLDWLQDVRTKGRKFRKVYVPSILKKTLQVYLLRRDEELQKKIPRLTPTLSERLPLFVSLRGSNIQDLTTFRLNEKSVWRVVHGVGRAAGVHPHLMRHTFAHRLLETTNDIRLVAQALGHSDVRVTMKYTERSDEDVARAMEDSLKTKSG
jgi:integrase/recombinase XerC